MSTAAYQKEWRQNDTATGETYEESCGCRYEKHAQREGDDHDQWWEQISSCPGHTQLKLSAAQRVYLEAMVSGPLRSGWGGYSSTVTVRLLAERGLCRLRTFPRSRGGEIWEAHITRAGREAIK